MSFRQKLEAIKKIFADPKDRVAILFGICIMGSGLMVILSAALAFTFSMHR